MKKFITIFSIFLFLSFNMNATPVTAQSKIFSQGFYTMKDLNLFENRTYSVQNTSPYNVGLLMIVDTNQVIQQIIRLSPQSPKYALIPLVSTYNFIVYGNVQLVFS